MTQFETAFIAAVAHDLPVGIWVAQAPNGEFLYANAAFNDIVGMPPDEDVLTGQYATVYRLHHQNGQPCADSDLPFARALREKATVTAEDLVIHHRDGTQLNVRAIAKPIFSSSGEVAYVVVAFYDVTPQVLAESARWRAETNRAEALAKALRARERAAIMHERLLDVVNHAPLIAFATDKNGVFTLAEGRVLAQLGVKPSDLIGQSIFDICRDYPAITANVTRALAGESFMEVVEAASLVFETWHAPIGGPEGGMLGVATDVTDPRRMQATLLSAERMVAVGTIAASVAHEINNPLSYVVACLDFLVREGKPVIQLAKTLRLRYPDDADIAGLSATLAKMTEPFINIRDGVERMRLIARDLRTFARADDHDASPVDVHDVLRSAIRMASNELRYRANVVSEFSEVPWVMASEPRLAQVFLNLLVNAAQAFPTGRPLESCEIRVVTSLDSSGQVMIEVRDNGPGIYPQILPRIFEPFFTTKPVGVGTGLGLSVCRNIVTSHGGSIAAKSELGRGSSFVVLLPAANGVRLETAVSDDKPARRPPTTRASVLVIDDDHVLGNAFRLTLSQEFKVRIAKSGAEALKVLSGGEIFDVIFCDLMMPDLTGMDVFAELSRVRPEIADKVLFMTGGVYTPEIRSFISRVPNRCLQKPFDPLVVARETLENTASQ
ncbi:MAG TPA: ATP-binding protein [Polyangiaceae bacterium]